MKNFAGKVLFLDRSDINTDEIIPAKYLTELTKEALAPHCLEDLALEGFDARAALRDVSVIVARANFGCGSSREHAPWALEANGVTVVIAESFARIFRANMFNCGMVAAEVPASKLDGLFSAFSGAETRAELDLSAGALRLSAPGIDPVSVPLALGPFERALVEAGGWVEYAAARY